MSAVMDDNYTFEKMNPAKILIVDDEVLGAMGLESSLKRMGYEVLGIAVTGDEAVKIAGEKNPDIILMDISLHGEMEGISAAETINREFNIPILFLTAHYRDNLLKRALKSNPYGYLNKPVRSVELRTAIETALHKHMAIEAEKKLFVTEKKHRALFERVAQGVLYLSASMDISDANPAIYGITGLKPDEIIGKNYLDVMNNSIREDGTVYPPEFHPHVHAFLTGKNTRDTFGILNTEENRYHWVVATAVPGGDLGSDGITESILTFEDITERIAAEERFFKAFEMLPVPIAIADLKNQTLVDANCVFLNHLGYERHEIVGKSLADFKMFADENEKKAFYDALNKKGGLKNMPVKALMSSGKIRNGYISAEIITIAGSPQVLISVIEDRGSFLAF